MVAAIPQVVVLDNLFDAHKALFVCFDLLQQFSKVAMRLVATAFDLVVVVAVSWYKIDDYLVGNEIFPVCASDGAAVVQH